MGWLFMWLPVSWFSHGTARLRGPQVQPGNSSSRAERSGSSMPRAKRLRWSTTHAPSRSPSGVVYEGCIRVHRLYCHRDRVGFAQLRVHHNRGGMNYDKVIERDSLEGNPRVQASLILRRGNPLQRLHQRQEVVLHPHRALLGRISAQHDGLLNFRHHSIITPKADTHSAIRCRHPLAA